MVENWLASHVSSVIQLKLKTVGETGTCSYIFYPSLYLGFSVRKLEDVEGRGEEGVGVRGEGGGVGEQSGAHWSLHIPGLNMKIYYSIMCSVCKLEGNHMKSSQTKSPLWSK